MLSLSSRSGLLVPVTLVIRKFSRFTIHSVARAYVVLLDPVKKFTRELIEDEGLAQGDAKVDVSRHDPSETEIDVGIGIIGRWL